MRSEEGTMRSDEGAMRGDEGAMASRHTGRKTEAEGTEDGGAEAERKEAEGHITCTPRAGWQ